MRSALCIVVLLAVGAQARGGVLTIWSASATYWTATDSVEIVLGFSRPPDLTIDYVGFAAWPQVERWPPANLLSLRNDDGGRAIRDEIIEMNHIVYRPAFTNNSMGVVDYELRGKVLTITLSLDDTGLPSPNFEFEALAQGAAEAPGYAIIGFSSIDHRVAFVPEPPSLILALLPLLAVPCWRRYHRAFRQVK